MIAVLSPAKSLNTSPAPGTVPHSLPDRLADSEELIQTLRSLSLRQIASLMSLSDNLATLNHERYHAWTPDFAAAQRDHRAKQALLAFNGDVYQGFALEEYSPADYAFAQQRLRILSGLHGLLRPLDLIQPYRLEMGCPLETKRGKNLYAFWGESPTEALNTALRDQDSTTLLNLASQEYFAAVNPSRLHAQIIHCTFKDEKAGQYKIISFFAKRARGLMADFIIRERLTKPRELKDFNAAGYQFDSASSTESSYVFLRPQHRA